MVYCSLKENTYYDSELNVFDYKLVDDKNNVIYFGHSVKNPKTGINRINITEIVRDYLYSNLEDDWPELSNEEGYVYIQKNSYRIFHLINGELTLETYGVLYNYTDEFIGERIVLAEPINGKTDPRMKIMLSSFDDIGYYFSLSENFIEFEYDGGVHYISATTNYDSIILECNDDWITATYVDGIITITCDLNVDEIERGTEIYVYGDFSTTIPIATITVLQSENEYRNMYFTVKATRNNIQPPPDKIIHPGLVISLGKNFDGIVKYKIDNKAWEEGRVIDRKTQFCRVMVSEPESYCGETRTIQFSIKLNSGSISIGAVSNRYDNYYSETSSDRYNDYEVYGNLLSLIYGNNFINNVYIREIDSFSFAGFKQLYNAENLAMPLNTVKECYKNMFNTCSNLTVAPKVLPATVLSESCYYNMFTACSNLVRAPYIAAKTLAISCCKQMFYGCSSLTTAPVLYGNILEKYCYEEMFARCSSLNYIKCLASYIGNRVNVYNWVGGVSPTGTFIKKTGVYWDEWDIPNGWEVEEADS